MNDYKEIKNIKIKAPLIKGALIICSLSFPSLANAQTAGADVEELREMVEAGEYRAAVRTGEEMLAENPAASKAGQIHQLLGEALYYTRGKREDSRDHFVEARKKGVADAALYLGRLSMADYDFPSAKKHYTDYRTLKKKSANANEELADEESYLSEAVTLFERVRELAVIDAVAVDKSGFFKHLRLPISAGRVVSVSELPLRQDGKERGEAAYISESGDLMMWSEEDEESGMMHIMEATKLTDGTLSDPIPSSDILGREGDAINPFLTADGTTLYYATNGEGSMGGFDIFIATRDPQTGEYLQPVNAGIPFNSYGDDYLLAIDEENGVGWWATDRHYLGDDKVTLYVFMLPDARKNIEASDEEKRKRSKLDDIRVTWQPLDKDSDEDSDEDEEDNQQEAGESKPTAEELAAEYRAKAAEIRQIQPGQRPRKHECNIPIKGGKMIYSADDVSTSEQKMIVERCIELEKEYKASEKELDKLRREYAANPSQTLGQRILQMESRVQKEYASLTQMHSQLYRALGYK
ncbi:MAG: hypothetical protein HDR48_04065 [Bacteroides sp.]|nr:hypothetical protein [Bacteroides sp.]